MYISHQWVLQKRSVVDGVTGTQIRWKWPSEWNEMWNLFPVLLLVRVSPPHSKLVINQQQLEMILNSGAWLLLLLLQTWFKFPRGLSYISSQELPRYWTRNDPYYVSNVQVQSTFLSFNRTVWCLFYSRIKDWRKRERNTDDKYIIHNMIHSWLLWSALTIKLRLQGGWLVHWNGMEERNGWHRNNS